MLSSKKVLNFTKSSKILGLRQSQPRHSSQLPSTPILLEDPHQLPTHLAMSHQLHLINFQQFTKNNKFQYNYITIDITLQLQEIAFSLFLNFQLPSHLKTIQSNPPPLPRALAPKSQRHHSLSRELLALLVQRVIMAVTVREYQLWLNKRRQLNVARRRYVSAGRIALLDGHLTPSDVADDSQLDHCAKHKGNAAEHPHVHRLNKSGMSRPHKLF